MFANFPPFCLGFSVLNHSQEYGMKLQFRLQLIILLVYLLTSLYSQRSSFGTVNLVMPTFQLNIHKNTMVSYLLQHNVINMHDIFYVNLC